MSESAKVSSSTPIAKIAFGAVIIVVAILLTWRDIATSTRELPPLLRFAGQKGAPAEALEIPIVHYRSKNWFGTTVRVDFVGAVHMGDTGYYERLNERFKQYDSVLFELIADAPRIAAIDQQSDSTLGVIQRKLSSLVGLDFQLDRINYRAPNFVHADMTPDQLVSAMEARGESLPQLLLKLLKISFDPKFQKAIEDTGFTMDQLEDVNPLMLLIREPTERERKSLRRFMAKGLFTSDDVLQALEGNDGGVIIGDRNAVAVSVLESELAKGKTNVAIFYGVGHLPDMHRRILSKLDLEIESVEWVKAWSL